jgi:hypothetical protein
MVARINDVFLRTDLPPKRKLLLKRVAALKASTDSIDIFLDDKWTSTFSVRKVLQTEGQMQGEGQSIYV